MRPIKFRAWDKKRKRMRDVVGIDFIRADEMAVTVAGKPNANEPICYELENDFVLIEYTGLKDANDKEIYEGDIVKVQHGPTHNINQYVVEHDNGMFCLDTFDSGYRITNALYSATLGPVCEVIGNIYENPELIGEEE